MPRLEHIGIAPEDVPAMADVIERLLGESVYRTETIEIDGVRTHFVWGGSAKLEVLEATSADSPVARFLARRGQGLHHLAFEVDDVRKMHERAREEGFEPLEDEPRVGADGKRIFFLHPRDTGAVLIEFCESATPLSRPVHAADVAGLTHLSVVDGSGARPALLCLGADAQEMAALARPFAPERTVYAAEAEASLPVPDLIEALDLAAVHLLAGTEFSRAGLQAAADARVRSVTLQDPDLGRGDVASADGAPILALIQSEEGALKAAGDVLRSLPLFQIVAASRSDFRTAVMERFFRSAD